MYNWCQQPTNDSDSAVFLWVSLSCRLLVGIELQQMNSTDLIAVYCCIARQHLHFVGVCLYENICCSPLCTRRKSIKNRKSQAKQVSWCCLFTKKRTLAVCKEEWKNRLLAIIINPCGSLVIFLSCWTLLYVTCVSVICTTSQFKDTASISCLWAWSSAVVTDWLTDCIYGCMSRSVTSADYHMIVAFDDGWMMLNDHMIRWGFPFDSLKIAFCNNGALFYMMEHDNKTWPWTTVKRQRKKYTVQSVYGGDNRNVVEVSLGKGGGWGG